MTMQSWIARGAVAVAVAFVACVVALHAEDSGVFKNSQRIREAQEILADNGYLEHGAFNAGEMDETTRKALAEYQRVHALNSSGMLDDETFQSLSSHSTGYPWDRPSVSATYQPEYEEPSPERDMEETPPAPEPTRTQSEPRASMVENHHHHDADRDRDRHETRKMPATGSDLPLLLLTGLGLIGGGALLLRQRAV